jgi:hypothetical protein
MSQQTRLTESETEQLVRNWYLLLDVHASVEELLPLLADEELSMKFPEGTLYGQKDFKNWYEVVTHKFFDEIHELKELDIHIEDDAASVRLIVNWQANVWNPPAARSQWLGFDAMQTWTVKRAPDTNQPVIVSYVVEELRPMEGSASL